MRVDGVYCNHCGASDTRKMNSLKKEENERRFVQPKNEKCSRSLDRFVFQNVLQCPTEMKHGARCAYCIRDTRSHSKNARCLEFLIRTEFECILNWSRNDVISINSRVKQTFCQSRPYFVVVVVVVVIFAPNCRTLTQRERTKEASSLTYHF